ncbi:hypothetical protein E2493_19435 [Sphingomonas parva]|uniref:Uncharacterized protein n=1 Tax=Sphingomonas parva TaxID=2555898 RepID=A0A4Y8ZKP1_9SPHN|nr:hypothetical protein [Sphingomonas parva]TFI56580.1 hypothetical protein E2493_19435 [Sphingomonas parva]
MWAYGDQAREASLASLLEELREAGDVLASAEPGLPWHSACVALFLRLAELLQALADAERDARGEDDLSPGQEMLMRGLIATAGAIDRSWRSGLAEQVPPTLAWLGLLGGGEDRALTVRRCEGWAFYAVYPELYLEAARALPEGAIVIGLRSIGAGLAALAASASRARAVVTVRPVGEPFDRRIVAGPGLERLVAGNLERDFVIVDEGPGLSGSSFGGTADWLERLGVPGERIHFMPSHDGDLGPQARDDHRAGWHARPRAVARFEDVLLVPGAPAPLARWFEDLTGPARAPLRDLSGGLWRSLSPSPGAPADPGREARKYLLETEQGRFLLKFVGLDSAGRDKLARARSLFEAGFSPEPLALRHGFLIERWMDGTSLEGSPPNLADYLAFRAQAFPAGKAGADLARLAGMARYNLGQSVGGAGERLLAPWTPERLEALQGAVRPVHVDGRLHAWEWIVVDGRVLKTDAVDHSVAHDLVGCQDIAWDVAGAAVELDLAPPALEALAAPLLGDRRALLDLLLPCYLAFQIGWWSYAGEAGARQQARYIRAAEKLMER